MAESARQCVEKDRKHKKTISTDMLDAVPVVLNSMLGASTSLASDELVKYLCLFFRRFPKMLMDVMTETIRQDPQMRKVFFSRLVDVHQLERGMLMQNVQLKFGGKIPDKRWKLKFSPILQASVQYCFIFRLTAIHYTCFSVLF